MNRNTTKTTYSYIRKTNISTTWAQKTFKQKKFKDFQKLNKTKNLYMASAFLHKYLYIFI